MSKPDTPASRCPICAGPCEMPGTQTGVRSYRPFCSKRCADIDLGRWVTGRYAIAAEEEDLPDFEDLRPDGLAH